MNSTLLICSLLWLLPAMALLGHLLYSSIAKGQLATPSHSPSSPSSSPSHSLDQRWILIAFSSWFLAAYVAMQMPPSALQSIYKSFRYLFMPQWLPSWTPMVPGEASEATRILPQLLQQLLIPLFWLMTSIRQLSLKGLTPSFKGINQLPLWVIALFCLTQGIDLLPAACGFEKLSKQLFDLPKSTLPYLLALASMLILAPINEELLFRRWLMGWLRPKIGLFLALLIQGALFALIHGFPHSFAGDSLSYGHSLALFGLGIGFGLCYAKNHCLALVILLHASYNGVMVFVSALQR